MSPIAGWKMTIAVGLVAIVVIAFVLAVALPSPYWKWAYYVTFLGWLGPAAYRLLRSPESRP